MEQIDVMCTLHYDGVATPDDQLVTDLVTMACKLGLDEALEVTPARLREYFEACRAQMNDCPFHNWHHVADITQCLYTVLVTTGMQKLLSQEQLIAVFLAGPAHDLDHRGRSNVLEINEGSDIAKKFPEEKGPLEVHHATLALETLERTAILENLSDSSRRIVRACVKNCILATDMGRHAPVMQGFTEATANLADPDNELRTVDFFVPGEKGWLLLGMLLKCCDVSNPARPISIADKWNALVYEEFYAEGDIDAQKGRPVNPLHNRETNNISKSSVGFIGFVVKKIYESLKKFTEAACLPHANALKPTGDTAQTPEKLKRLSQYKSSRHLVASLRAEGWHVFIDSLEANSKIHALRAKNAASDALCTLHYDGVATPDDQLVTDLVTMACRIGLDEALKVTPARLREYFEACRAQMNDCPFHNWHHVADITQCLYTVLVTTGMQKAFSQEQLIAVFLAGPAHDLDHRGRSNVLEINEGSDIARKFPEEKGPLEAHHATLALETLERTAILENLSDSSRRIVRACVKNCILATDMGRHAPVMQGFTEATANLADPDNELRTVDFFVPGEKGWLLLGMLLKCCDVSNPARPISIADKWNALVYEEFYAEGDIDAQKGRPVNPLHNRETNNISKSSVGFIGFVVAKIYESLNKFTEAACLPHAITAKPTDGTPQTRAKQSEQAARDEAMTRQFGEILKPAGWQVFVDSLESNKEIHAERGLESPRNVDSLRAAGLAVKTQLRRGSIVSGLDRTRSGRPAQRKKPMPSTAEDGTAEPTPEKIDE
jgi:high affinity cGMP-specific 3',5'-cyclic phosphodiesterase 9